MQIQPIEVNPFTLNCPSCSAALLSLSGSEVQCDSEAPWMLDGDAIPGIRQALGANAVKGLAYIAFLYQCRCSACGAEFHSSEVLFSTVSMDHLYDFLADGAAGATVRNFVANHPTQPRPWAVQRICAAPGAVIQHLLGPTGDAEDLRGPNGVSACGAADSVASPWARARDVVVSAWPALVEATARTQQVAIA